MKKKSLETIGGDALGDANGGANPVLAFAGGYLAGKAIDYGAKKTYQYLKHRAEQTPKENHGPSIFGNDRSNHKPTTPFRGPKF